MARILVIDDDPQLRRLLRRYFERHHHAVAEAADGNEGLARFHESGADIIITDLIMPGKEGMETILELRRNNPDVKVIAMSGGGRVAPAGYLKLAKGIGASRVFSKPFELAELHQAVEELIGENPS